MRHILCFGNPLHGDDGFGPAVFGRLKAFSLPRDLRLFDVGTPGLAALTLFEDCEEAVIVDTLAPNGSPGRLSQLLPEAIAIESTLPGHAVGVGYLLQALAALEQPRPRIRIVAVEAMAITPFQPGLSAPVYRAVDEVVSLLRPYFDCCRHG